MFTKSTLTALAALAAFSLAGAHPASAQETVSVKVPYGDLDLGKDAGAKAMLQRIRHAARTICGEPDGSLNAHFQYRSCFKSTTDRAVAAFGNPMVTAMNSGRSAAIQLASAKP
ncbi:MAG: UrcA family protein [Caulobacteraceae bacterium]|nr:UrcA family protein [Caulobacteraceae bacterium]